ncbi:MAG TPA: hypothetical protein VIB00_17775 [Pyrinomonadaceae bacterium]|jgi:hypothetical protein
MNVGTFTWLLIFGISAVVFFVIAGVVAVKGFRDLIDLLDRSPSE